MIHFSCHHFHANWFVWCAHLCLFLPSDRQKNTLMVSKISSRAPGWTGHFSRGSWAGALFMMIEVCPTHLTENFLLSQWPVVLSVMSPHCSVLEFSHVSSAAKGMSRMPAFTAVILPWLYPAWPTHHCLPEMNSHTTRSCCCSHFLN